MTAGSTNRVSAAERADGGLFSSGQAVEKTASAEDMALARPGADADANVDAPADNSWRGEVTARLARYRTRRKPRAPRYPSLYLPFDASESWSRCASARGSEAALTPALNGTGGAPHSNAEPAVVPADTTDPHAGGMRATPERAADPSAKIIEFPRLAAIPIFHAAELAEPVFERPRIVEAPEILPPPPALGGMLIEPAQGESADKQFKDESPPAAASVGRRALAALVDGAVLGVALVVFAAIFLHLNPGLNAGREHLPVLAAALVAVAVSLWVAYEFLFVIYTGSTPGLRALRLRLARFDGSPIHRRLRRWRALASLLSAFSVGLGYLWCLFDQDRLCWHDRITRTHVRSGE